MANLLITTFAVQFAPAMHVDCICLQQESQTLFQAAQAFWNELGEQAKRWAGEKTYQLAPIGIDLPVITVKGQRVAEFFAKRLKSQFPMISIDATPDDVIEALKASYLHPSNNGEGKQSEAFVNLLYFLDLVPVEEVRM